MEAQVIAGGGLVWDGALLLVVHRPRYDDWSLPKGKIDPVDRGDVLACAVREVREETGTEVSVGARAGQTRYRSAGPGGVAAVKVVDYWHMARTGGAFTPNREVDVVQWVDVAIAQTLLTYGRDRLLLEGVTPGATSALGVFRRFEAALLAGDGDGLDAVAGDGVDAGSVRTLIGADLSDVTSTPDGTVSFTARLPEGGDGVGGRAVVADGFITTLHLDDRPA